MLKPSLAVLAALTLGLVSACYKNAGPVLTSVRQDARGLHFVRCDLIVGRSLFNIGNDDLEHCVDETGKAAPSPSPASDVLGQELPSARDGGAD